MNKLLGIAFCVGVCIVLGFGPTGCTKKAETKKVEESKKTEGPGGKENVEKKTTETGPGGKKENVEKKTTETAPPKADTVPAPETKKTTEEKKVTETKKDDKKKED